MEEKVCSKCGGSGPFPATGNICKACRHAYQAAWYQKNKARINAKPHKSPAYKRERDVAKQRRYKARHPEQYRAYRRELARRNYANNPAYRDRVRAYQKARYQQKKEEK